jgi:hypothetical protein
VKRGSDNSKQSYMNRFTKWMQVVSRVFLLLEIEKIGK